MMDPIVDEVRNARQEHAQKFNNNLDDICDDLKRIEKECGHKIVSLQPKILINKPPNPS